MEMEAHSSFSEECSDAVQINKLEDFSENLMHVKAAAGEDGSEEQEPMGLVTAVQDGGRQEKVSYQCLFVCLFRY